MYFDVKKVIYSLIIIVSTIISTLIMYKCNYDMAVQYKNTPQKVFVQKDNIEDKESSNDEKEEVPQDSDKNQTESSSQDQGNNLKENNKNETSENSNQSEQNNDSEPQSQNENNADVSSRSTCLNSNELFRVNSQSIMSKLSGSDKLQLLYIISKLSKSDYKTIQNYLQNEDDAKGVVDTMKLLKKDLNQNDYGRVRGVASKFIYLNYLDSLK